MNSPLGSVWVLSLLTPRLIHPESARLRLHLSPSTPLSAVSSHPLSQPSLFKNTTLCALNANYISVSFIRLGALSAFGEQCPHHQARLFIHDDSEAAKDPDPFSGPPNIHWITGLTLGDNTACLVDILRAESIIVANVIQAHAWRRNLHHLS